MRKTVSVAPAPGTTGSDAAVVPPPRRRICGRSDTRLASTFLPSKLAPHVRPDSAALHGCDYPLSRHDLASEDRSPEREAALGTLADRRARFDPVTVASGLLIRRLLAMPDSLRSSALRTGSSERRGQRRRASCPTGGSLASHQTRGGVSGIGFHLRGVAVFWGAKKTPDSLPGVSEGRRLPVTSS